ncbi:putative kinase [Paenibacillus cellulosilyticus]|uniref:Putative kinase n=2 Tax=Paenibacillus cellulosilyticus TaxID=375489 RepID=A0A2V2Z3F9_9BACL|nr:putative kinase [Paenibacillus cellulosilyticus]QKS46594.1 ATP-binding protein [Paenibacillus cellulosilyticus]
MVDLAESIDLTKLLGREKDTGHPVVVLMCGIAGSGKTTISQRLAELGYNRLSIDEEVWKTNGRYGVDYPVEQYRANLDAAHKRLLTQIVEHIQENKPVVVDSSFWNRRERDWYKQLIEQSGGRWRLLYLRVQPDELRRRLKVRSERFDANAAFPITEELLHTFINGFEEPKDEGEIIIDN